MTTENTLFRSNTGLKKDICILGLVKRSLDSVTITTWNNFGADLRKC